jgi:hypothetical protein
MNSTAVLHLGHSAMRVVMSFNVDSDDGAGASTVSPQTLHKIEKPRTGGRSYA